MSVITLSGGEFGGTTVEASDWAIGEVREFSGWLYRLYDEHDAVHCGYA